VSEEYLDPRLVALHDELAPERPDIPFYVDLAAQLRAATVADVGCGTGRLAVELARRGHRVVGFDPSPAMLDAARRRPGGDLVRWVHGDASHLTPGEWDLVVLSGNVVQEITDDRALLATFAAIRRALRPDGRLAFDSRNPAARCWIRWTPRDSRRTLAGGVEVWYANTRVDGDRVGYETHYRFPSGVELVSRGELRFRSYGWLKHALAGAGFAIHPMDADAPDLLFLATAAPPRRVTRLDVDGTSPYDWRATIHYDIGEPVTVFLEGLYSLELLARLRELGVPHEMVYAEAARLGIDWDPEEEVRVRSEADMAEWRRRDRERRERLKREFRERRSED
jgi:SAM-dependent methyltransferase